MLRSTTFIRFIFLTALVLAATPSVYATDRDTGILLTAPQGQVLFSQNPDIPFVPASTLKLLTSLAALDHFGPHFRFQTLAAWDGKDLYIKGLGDPLFVSEAIEGFCRKVGVGLERVENIRLDQSFFTPDIHIPGTGRTLNPYDATTGALCANFNTIFFKWDSSGKRFVSAEPQTPLLKVFFRDVARTGLKKGRILLDPDQRLTYAGLLVRHFLKEQGVVVTGEIETSPFAVPPDGVISVDSPYAMTQVVEKLLKYSNNFIANQLMLVMGARQYGPPATLEKGVAALSAFAQKKIEISNLVLAEGSGLSRKNRITPLQMMEILRNFKPYHTLLSVSKNEYYKTGTLSDVRSRAGFIRGRAGSLYPFVILINKKNKGYGKILSDLKKRVAVHERTSATGS